MNERIKELRLQAITECMRYDEEYGTTVSQTDEVFEKFAELIVRECADLVADDDNAFDILKHFGVEE